MSARCELWYPDHIKYTVEIEVAEILVFETRYY
jgi:hypothetical protein